jgi:hypothetical protein
MSADILQEQVQYYRERASEYDVELSPADLGKCLNSMELCGLKPQIEIFASQSLSNERHDAPAYSLCFIYVRPTT